MSDLGLLDLLFLIIPSHPISCTYSTFSHIWQKYGLSQLQLLHIDAIDHTWRQHAVLNNAHREGDITARNQQSELQIIEKRHPQSSTSIHAQFDGPHLNIPKISHDVAYTYQFAENYHQYMQDLYTFAINFLLTIRQTSDHSETVQRVWCIYLLYTLYLTQQPPLYHPFETIQLPLPLWSQLTQFLPTLKHLAHDNPDPYNCLKHLLSINAIAFTSSNPIHTFPRTLSESTLAREPLGILAVDSSVQALFFQNAHNHTMVSLENAFSTLQSTQHRCATQHHVSQPTATSTATSSTAPTTTLLPNSHQSNFLLPNSYNPQETSLPHTLSQLSQECNTSGATHTTPGSSTSSTPQRYPFNVLPTSAAIPPTSSSQPLTVSIRSSRRRGLQTQNPSLSAQTASLHDNNDLTLSPNHIPMPTPTAHSSNQSSTHLNQTHNSNFPHLDRKMLTMAGLLRFFHLHGTFPTVFSRHFFNPTSSTSQLSSSAQTSNTLASNLSAMLQYLPTPIRNQLLQIYQEYHISTTHSSSNNRYSSSQPPIFTPFHSSMYQLSRQLTQALQLFNESLKSVKPPISPITSPATRSSELKPPSITHSASMSDGDSRSLLSYRVAETANPTLQAKLTTTSLRNQLIMPLISTPSIHQLDSDHFRPNYKRTSNNKPHIKCKLFEVIDTSLKSFSNSSNYSTMFSSTRTVPLSTLPQYHSYFTVKKRFKSKSSSTKSATALVRKSSNTLPSISSIIHNHQVFTSFVEQRKKSGSFSTTILHASHTFPWQTHRNRATNPSLQTQHTNTALKPRKGTKKPRTKQFSSPIINQPPPSYFFSTLTSATIPGSSLQNSQNYANAQQYPQFSHFSTDFKYTSDEFILFRYNLVQPLHIPTPTANRLALLFDEQKKLRMFQIARNGKDSSRTSPSVAMPSFTPTTLRRAQLNQNHKYGGQTRQTAKNQTPASTSELTAVHRKQADQLSKVAPKPTPVPPSTYLPSILPTIFTTQSIPAPQSNIPDNKPTPTLPLKTPQTAPQVQPADQTAPPRRFTRSMLSTGSALTPALVAPASKVSKPDQRTTRQTKTKSKSAPQNSPLPPPPTPPDLSSFANCLAPQHYLNKLFKVLDIRPISTTVPHFPPHNIRPPQSHLHFTQPISSYVHPNALATIYPPNSPTPSDISPSASQQRSQSISSRNRNRFAIQSVFKRLFKAPPRSTTDTQLKIKHEREIARWTQRQFVTSEDLQDGTENSHSKHLAANSDSIAYFYDSTSFPFNSDGELLISQSYDSQWVLLQKQQQLVNAEKEFIRFQNKVNRPKRSQYAQNKLSLGYIGADNATRVSSDPHAPDSSTTPNSIPTSFLNSLGRKSLQLSNSTPSHSNTPANHTRKSQIQRATQTSAFFTANPNRLFPKLIIPYNTHLLPDHFVTGYTPTSASTTASSLTYPHISAISTTTTYQPFEIDNISKALRFRVDGTSPTHRLYESTYSKATFALFSSLLQKNNSHIPLPPIHLDEDMLKSVFESDTLMNDDDSSARITQASRNPKKSSTLAANSHLSNQLNGVQTVSAQDQHSSQIAFSNPSRTKQLNCFISPAPNTNPPASPISHTPQPAAISTPVNHYISYMLSHISPLTTATSSSDNQPNHKLSPNPIENLIVAPTDSLNQTLPGFLWFHYFTLTASERTSLTDEYKLRINAHHEQVSEIKQLYFQHVLNNRHRLNPAQPIPPLSDYIVAENPSTIKFLQDFVDIHTNAQHYQRLLTYLLHAMAPSAKHTERFNSLWDFDHDDSSHSSTKRVSKKRLQNASQSSVMDDSILHRIPPTQDSSSHQPTVPVLKLSYFANAVELFVTSYTSFITPTILTKSSQPSGRGDSALGMNAFGALNAITQQTTTTTAASNSTLTLDYNHALDNILNKTTLATKYKHDPMKPVTGIGLSTPFDQNLHKNALLLPFSSFSPTFQPFTSHSSQITGVPVPNNGSGLLDGIQQFWNLLHQFFAHTTAKLLNFAHCFSFFRNNPNYLKYFHAYIIRQSYHTMERVVRHQFDGISRETGLVSPVLSSLFASLPPPVTESIQIPQNIPRQVFRDLKSILLGNPSSPASSVLDALNSTTRYPQIRSETLTQQLSSSTPINAQLASTLSNPIALFQLLLQYTHVDSINQDRKRFYHSKHYFKSTNSIPIRARRAMHDDENHLDESFFQLEDELDDEFDDELSFEDDDLTTSSAELGSDSEESDGQF